MKLMRKSLGGAMALALFFICSADLAHAQTNSSPQSLTWPARLSHRGDVWTAPADLPRKATAETEAPAVTQPDPLLDGASFEADENDWAHAYPKIVTFDPPGAVLTFAYAINPAGAIVGEYFDANGMVHGFLRELDGRFTIIDVPGHGIGAGLGTIAWSINPAGEIAGTYRDQNGAIHSFLRTRDGRFTSFDAPGAGTDGSQQQGTYAQNINPEGEIAGDYTDAANVYHGFVRTCDGRISEFDAPGAGTGAGQGIYVSNVDGVNGEGAVAGSYLDDLNVFHGFVRARDGEITEFDVPGAGSGAGQGTEVGGINERGENSGSYVDGNSVAHGFIRARDGSITTFDAPGAGSGPNQGTYPSNINSRGDVTAYYVDASGASHGFLRYRDGTVVTFDVPDAIGTFPNCNNAINAITGSYLDTKGALHGFLRTP